MIRKCKAQNFISPNGQNNNLILTRKPSNAKSEAVPCKERKFADLLCAVSSSNIER